MLWWLEIPYPLLRSWSNSGLYVEKLNSACEEAALPLKPPNKRREENVRVQVAAVIRKYRAAQRVGGNSAKTLNSKPYKLAVLSSEVTHMHDLKEKDVNSIRAWPVKYENLEQEKQRLYEEMVEELREWQHKRVRRCSKRMPN